MRRFIAGAAAALMLFSSAAALPQEFSLFAGSTLTASAASITINSTDVTIFFLNKDMAEYLTQPSSAPKKFQLKVTGAKNVSYKIKSGECVNVSSTGLITPVVYTRYRYGNAYYSEPQSGLTLDEVVKSSAAGESVIEVTADGKKFTVNVSLENYADYYVEKQITDYIAKNVKSTMTAKEKVTEACKMAASYDYSPYYSGMSGMIIHKGGDCWASTELIIYFCKKCGLDAWGRRGYNDPGAGSGHRNVMVYGDGKYYEADAGYIGNAPRYYSVIERSSLYSYRDADGGLEIYQYDGKTTPATMKIPTKVNGQKVVSVGEDFAYRNTTVEKLIVPEGIKKIGPNAFYDLENLKSIELPASLTDLDPTAFAANDKLETIKIASGNKNYTVSGGAIYDKKKTKLVSCPAAAKLTIPSTVKTIGDHAFDGNYNLRSLTVPEGITALGEYAFNDCGFLEKLTLPSTLKTIGEGAFRYCYSLYNLTVPASVTSMGKLCFEQAPDNNYEHAIYGKKGSAAETYAKNNSITFRTGKSISSCTISIPYFEYTYTGSVIKPKLTVKDGSKILTEGKDYTAEYPGYADYGSQSINLYGKGSYSGLASKTYMVKPEKISITSLDIINGSGIKVSYSQPEKYPAYYEVCYSKDPDFKTSYTTRRFFNQFSVNLTSKPKAGETWYVKARAVACIGYNFDRKPYGNWSAVKSVTVSNNISGFKITIPYSSYTYTGKAITPAVTVKNRDNKLVKGKDYTVSYSSNTKVGVATVKITGTGNYKGTVTKTFVVKPARNAVASLTTTKGAFKLKWNKATAGAVGYQVLYSRSKAALTDAVGEVKSSSAAKYVHSYTSTNLSDLSESFSKHPNSGETWYVKVRSFVTKDGKASSTRYGNYSTIASIKVK